MNDLKWIACRDLDMNPYNLSVPEKLRNFGYALVFDEFGNGKTAKAQLCIHKLLAGESRPNILIICPESLTQSWYSTLISELGVDFKLVSGSDNTVSFYSKSISNLYIMSEEHLENAAVGGDSGGDGVVWDLMIIDSSLSVMGARWELYRSKCRNRTRELLIFATSPFPYDKDDTYLLKDTLKSLLYDASQREIVDNLEIDENIIEFNKDAPAMRYYNTSAVGAGRRNVVILEYEIDKRLTAPNNRIVDLQTGSPVYIYGGNVFEEYNVDIKHIYSRPYYSKDDIDALCAVDSKLKVFLGKLDSILKKPDSGTVIYFASKSALNYVTKVLNALYPDLSRYIKTQTGSAVDGAFLKSYFSGQDSTDARVILATDAIGERYHALKKVTHVINYEYPDAPDELERRFFRSGMENSPPEEFVLFTDTGLMFDGRILCKVMMSGLYKCFKRNIPSRNVLFWVPGAEKYIAYVLLDLKFNAENSGGAGLEYARKFRSDYNIADPEQVSNAAKAGERAKRTLTMLVGLLDIADSMEGEVKFESLAKAAKESVEQIRDGYLYYDANMKPRLVKNENNINAISRHYADNEFVTGLKSAEEALDAMIKGVNYPFIRNEIEELPDCLKTPVLYNIWKYCRVKRGIKKPLREFMSMYNKGVI